MTKWPWLNVAHAEQSFHLTRANVQNVGQTFLGCRKTPWANVARVKPLFHWILHDALNVVYCSLRMMSLTSYANGLRILASTFENCLKNSMKTVMEPSILMNSNKDCLASTSQIYLLPKLNDWWLKLMQTETASSTSMNLTKF